MYEVTGCTLLAVAHEGSGQQCLHPLLFVGVGSPCPYHTVSEATCEPDSVSKMGGVCGRQRALLQAKCYQRWLRRLSVLWRPNWE